MSHTAPPVRRRDGYTVPGPHLPAGRTERTIPSPLLSWLAWSILMLPSAASDPVPLVAAEHARVPTPPWALTWADGSGNISRIWQDQEGGEARLAYEPVRPETSSSGVYSGGEARRETLPPERVAELWTLARAVARDAPRAETRAKGTGVLTLSEPTGTTEALVVASPATAALDAALRRP